MSEGEILEGNSLIAEFMGIPKREQTGFEHPSNLSYNSSWDWLMPVVENIEGAGHTMHIVRFDVCIKENNTISSPTICFIQGNIKKGKIIVVYKSVIEFIKWYNNQQK